VAGPFLAVRKVSNINQADFNKIAIALVVKYLDEHLEYRKLLLKHYSVLEPQIVESSDDDSSNWAWLVVMPDPRYFAVNYISERHLTALTGPDLKTRYYTADEIVYL
jgi:hypothetical protein